ncbi:MAG: DNA repair protein [SAR86 cluster bacterium]|uniref:DNA repair protein n=1 Tax=SAR86 cluster bacterium TaxID=2030880 RepID=A0A2A5B670_9GAMM|nr:MAG: DNA repair protein [SAR86 cluster bacterium]
MHTIYNFYPALPGLQKKLAAVTVLFLLSACSTVYYETMEQFGIHKRDILVDRVEQARDSQEAAKEQFSSALEQFSALLNFNGGDLQETYESLNREFEKSEERASSVSERIRAVESVSADLFEEWEEELSLYTSQSLRASSESSLRSTRVRYEQLVASMHSAENKMTPVINAFRDQVLFLKHNLNSRAIASLRTELSTIEDDISELIQDMEASIAESNRFLSELAII